MIVIKCEQGEQWERDSGNDTKQRRSMNWGQRMVGVGGVNERGALNKDYGGILLGVTT